MADESQNTDVPLPIDSARVRLQASIADLEKSLFHLGYDYGFNAGWDAAVRRIASAGTQKPDNLSPPSLVDLDASAKDDPPAREVVLRLIQENPGLRGMELVAAAARAGSPLNERTIRTALHRLRAAERIRNDDGKWYAVSTDDGQAAA